MNVLLLLSFIYFMSALCFSRERSAFCTTFPFFVLVILLLSLCPSPRSCSLTSDKMAKSWAFLLHDSAPPPIPTHSQPRPKRGDPPRCTDTVFLSKNLGAGPPASHETGHVCWSGTWIQPTPHSSVSRLLCELKVDPVCGCTVVFTLVGGVGVGKWCISYWSSRRRMGILYNVELVNYVLWDDSSELLFLFYDLSVSVKWITAVYIQRRLVCIIILWQRWLCPLLCNARPKYSRCVGA